MGLPLRSPVAKLSCDAATEANAKRRSFMPRTQLPVRRTYQSLQINSQVTPHRNGYQRSVFAPNARCESDCLKRGWSGVSLRFAEHEEVPLEARQPRLVYRSRLMSCRNGALIRESLA